MFISRRKLLLILDRLENLEKRIKRLELMEYEAAQRKIANLRREAGDCDKNKLLTIEEIINK